MLKLTDLDARNPLYLAIRWSSQALFVTAFSFRVSGQENIPSVGGCILACNHQSYLDPPIVACAAGRPVQILARSSLFNKKAFAHFIAMLGAVPIERDGLGLNALKTAVKTAKSGIPVLIFPEGTRTRDGSIGSVKPSVGMIACMAGVPVVPTIIHGAFEAWPRSISFPRPRPIKVIFGKTIDPSGYEKSKEGYRLMSDRLREAMSLMQKEVHRRRQGR